MAEYIKREALYEKGYWHGEHPDVGNPFPDGVDAFVIKDVDAIPAADVAPVRHGRWLPVRVGFWTSVFECSECHRRVKLSYDEVKTFEMLNGRYPFCHCGAKMDLKQ